MAYAVKLADLARNEALEYLAFILSRSNDPIAAEDWWAGLLQSLRSLRTPPTRCPALPTAAPHSTSPGKPVRRQLLYHSHRTVFRIDEATQTVFVLRIYHNSRRPLLP
ncbi:MAG: type II toxin-antitoxin system RelE/ParE family toxin [Acidobacteriaceae bacterium]